MGIDEHAQPIEIGRVDHRGHRVDHLREGDAAFRSNCSLTLRLISSRSARRAMTSCWLRSRQIARPRRKLDVIDRAEEEIGGPRLQRGKPVLMVIIGGDDDDRHRARASAHLAAVSSAPDIIGIL